MKSFSKILFLVLLLFISSFSFFVPKILADSDTFTYSGNMHTVRSGQTATVLSNGKVLIVGGNNYFGAAELYDMATGEFSLTGNLTPRGLGSTATMLQNW